MRCTIVTGSSRRNCTTRYTERETQTHIETYRLTEALNEMYDSDCIRQEELCNQVHRQKERDTQRQ